MQHQIQSYIIGYCCHCGAEARYCDDWDKLEFCEPDPNCRCELHYEIPETDKEDRQFRRMFPVKHARFERGVV